MARTTLGSDGECLGHMIAFVEEMSDSFDLSHLVENKSVYKIFKIRFSASGSPGSYICGGSPHAA